jgi:hypothetical protein
MKEFLMGLLGQTSGNDFAHAFIWALVGAVLSLLLNVATRDPNTTHSPVKFSWLHFIADNLRRILSTLMLIIVCLRFMPDLFGVQLSAFAAFCVGFGWDKLAQFIKDKGWLGRTSKSQA